MGKHSIQVRLENLADLFDAANGLLMYKAVNIQKLAQNLFLFANDNKAATTDFTVEI